MHADNMKEAGLSEMQIELMSTPFSMMERTMAAQALEASDKVMDHNISMNKQHFVAS